MRKAHTARLHCLCCKIWPVTTKKIKKIHILTKNPKTQNTEKYFIDTSQSLNHSEKTNKKEMKTELSCEQALIRCSEHLLDMIQ